jgi:probable O-glycosylation ligase (exosortase A-associated)
MRDIVLSLVVAGLLPWALLRPVIGAYLWAWLSIMNPHMLTFGFARSIPFAMMAAIVTLTGLLFSKQRKALPMNGGTVILILLTIWVSVTSLVAITPADLVWERWIFGIKILVMLFATLMLLRGRQEIEILIWVLLISVGFFGVKGGLFTVITGGASRVWGPTGGMLQGNNELAVALVLLMPFAYYMVQTTKRVWVSRLTMVGMAACAFAIVGTQSRGALLALVSMGFVLGLKGKHPVRTLLVMVSLIATVIAFMPSTWSDRMDTIQDYRRDGSAMSRIYTWKTLWNAAIDRPLTGTGFRADHEVVFSKYAPDGADEVFRGSVYVAHSIYFQALGEHGFPGLALYAGLGFWAWFASSRLIRRTRDHPEFGEWVPPLMRMCQASLVGFGVGGAFLSLMLLDLPYYVIAIVILVHATVRESMERTAPVQPAPRNAQLSTRRSS